MVTVKLMRRRRRPAVIAPSQARAYMKRDCLQYRLRDAKQRILTAVSTTSVSHPTAENFAACRQRQRLLVIVEGTSIRLAGCVEIIGARHQPALSSRKKQESLRYVRALPDFFIFPIEVDEVVKRSRSATPINYLDELMAHLPLASSVSSSSSSGGKSERSCRASCCTARFRGRERVPLYTAAATLFPR
jgi:hypothetical protein